MSREYINECELPNNFYDLDHQIQINIINYLEQLNTIEVRAYGIAKSHLGTSFNILRSNGYNDWLKKNEKK
jgi:hypothetical protein